jgi:hypothetical protein
MPDFHANPDDALRHIQREQARLERMMAEFYSHRTAIVGQQQNPRLARTLVDANADPTYPVQGIDGGDTFPITFLDGGFTHTAGRHTAQYTAHRATPQAMVRVLSDNWLPIGTVLQVWQDRGSDASYTGEWWADHTDHLRIGITIDPIDQDANGDVAEWSPNNYDAESDLSRTWLCRNWCGYSIEAGTRCFFQQIFHVAYILQADCAPVSS